MPGLAPGIHAWKLLLSQHESLAVIGQSGNIESCDGVDDRDKPGHDGVEGRGGRDSPSSRQQF